jgi:hypothetical protein
MITGSPLMGLVRVRVRVWYINKSFVHNFNNSLILNFNNICRLTDYTKIISNIIIEINGN